MNQRSLLAAFVVSASITALPTSASERPSFTPWELTVYGVQMPETSVQPDGKLEQANYGFDLSFTMPVQQGWVMTTSMDYYYTNFDGQGYNLAGYRDWDNQQDLGFGLNFVKPSKDSWTWFVGPRVHWAWANTADASDGFGYGLLAGASYPVKKNLVLGGGLGYFNDPYAVSMIPVLFIRWEINDRWTLDNPFEPSFSGRAGLELSYQLSPEWQFGFGSAYRQQRFAIDEGTVEISQPISFLRASFMQTNWHLSAFLGYRDDGDLEYHGQQNRKLDVDAESALGLSATFTF